MLCQCISRRTVTRTCQPEWPLGTVPGPPRRPFPRYVRARAQLAATVMVVPARLAALVLDDVDRMAWVGQTVTGEIQHSPARAAGPEGP